MKCPKCGHYAIYETRINEDYTESMVGEFLTIQKLYSCERCSIEFKVKEEYKLINRKIVE